MRNRGVLNAVRKEGANPSGFEKDHATATKASIRLRPRNGSPTRSTSPAPNRKSKKKPGIDPSPRSRSS